MVLTDFKQNNIRLTDERLDHIKEHPEMAANIEKIHDVLLSPDIVVKSRSDEESRLYYKLYEGLSISL